MGKDDVRGGFVAAKCRIGASEEIASIVMLDDESVVSHGVQSGHVWGVVSMRVDEIG